MQRLRVWGDLSLVWDSSNYIGLHYAGKMLLWLKVCVVSVPRGGLCMSSLSALETVSGCSFESSILTVDVTLKT